MFEGIGIMVKLKTVLIIDDDIFVSKTLQIGLRENGYITICAKNGIEGLEVIKNQNPDIVICDRVMPEFSGFQLLKTLREDHPSFTSPFIFISSLDDQRDINAVAELSPTSYLTKPINLDDLLLALKSSLAE